MCIQFSKNLVGEIIKEQLELEGNVLLKGDCLELMKYIPDNSIDCVLTDPPYGTTACKWDSVIPFEPMWKELKRIIKPNGAICLFGSEPFSSYLRMSNIKMFKYDWIWDKVRSTGFLNANRQPLRCHEVISVFYVNQTGYNPQKTAGHKLVKGLRKVHHQAGEIYGKTNRDNSYASTERFPRSIQIVSTDTRNSSLHPTQKPVLLLEYLIKTYTLEKETVLDFTMGSGSTGVACKNLNRKFIGIEMDDKYFEIAKNRIE